MGYTQAKINLTRPPLPFLPSRKSCAVTPCTRLYRAALASQTFCDSFRIREATLSCTENRAWHTVDADRMNMYQAYHC